jgi:hypothetical protein
MAWSGSLTGKYPRDKKKRDMMINNNIPPYAIKLGDRWISYREIEPFSTAIGMVANVNQELRDGMYDSDVEFGEAMANATWAIVESFFDSPWLQGISSLSEQWGWERTYQRLPSMLVPYSGMGRYIADTIEAWDGKGARIRDRSMASEILNVIPGLSRETPARLNVWGEEVAMAGTKGDYGPFKVWLPIKWSRESDDPVEVMLKEELEYYPGLPGRNVAVRGEDIRLPDKLYRDYCISYGKAGKEAIASLMEKPIWKRMDKKGKERKVEAVLRGVRTRKLNQAKRIWLDEYK